MVERLNPTLDPFEGLGFELPEKEEQIIAMGQKCFRKEGWTLADSESSQVGST
jgi:hypothetical protein